jgi:diguanylate cyclase
MIARWYFSSYSLARRITLTTVTTLVVMLLLAGLTLAAVFANAQIEQSRVAALTQASVASTTVAAAMRFGGTEVIAETLRVFDGGSDPDSAAVYDRQGRLVSEFVAYGEHRFPQELAALATRPVGILQARPVQFVLNDDQLGAGSATLGTLVVNPNQGSLSTMFSRALTVLALVLAISTLAGIWVANVLSRALLRPVVDLTTWAEAVSKTRNLQAPAPRGRAREVGRLTSSFESLIAQLDEQNRELKRKQYELKAYNDHLETMAFSDSLTGLPNRAMFEATLGSEISSARTSDRRFAVLFADIDNLKVINDTYGHAQGDDALRATASRMRRALRSTDFLARLAGDEFVVVSSNVATTADAVKLGERLTVWLGISLPEDQWTLPIRVSIGVTVFPDDGDDIASLMHAADQAMYRAKALPSDDSIRVARAGDVIRNPATWSGADGASNVIAWPTPHRKTHTGS